MNLHIAVVLLLSLFLIIKILYKYNNVDKEHFTSVIQRDNDIIDKILDRLYIRSGGHNTNQEFKSNSAYIKFNGKVLVHYGSNGFNIVVIERSHDMKVKHVVNIDTGINYLANDALTDLILNHIDITDIVIFVVKRDAFKLLSTESRFQLKKLGALNAMTRSDMSYILIGSLDKKVYFEEWSGDNDVYFPKYNYYNLGYWTLMPNLVSKKIKIIEGKNKDKKKDTLSLINRYNSVQTCALEAMNSGKRVFTVDNDNCSC